MALFGLINTQELEEFAGVLASDLGRRFPPASEARTDPGAKYQLKVILEGLGARAVRYHGDHKLNVYRKAKLGNISPTWASTGEPPKFLTVDVQE